MNKNLTSELISFARFPLAICVVMIHCFFSIKGWQYDHLADQGFGSNVAMEFIISTRIIILFVVALFFLISGYLFFLHLEEWNSDGWLRKMKRRFWTLLIPYLLWNTLYILYIIGPDICDWLAHEKPWDVVKAWVDDHGGWIGLYWNAKSLGMGQVEGIQLIRQCRFSCHSISSGILLWWTCAHHYFISFCVPVMARFLHMPL